MNESEIIELFYDGTGPRGSARYLDDCAELPQFYGQIPGQTSCTLVTTDSMTENIHFRLDWSEPEALAIKLFQVNMSDLCSSGGRPAFCLLNLGIPQKLGRDFLKRFAVALNAQLREYKCELIGGDTYRAMSLELTLTLGGPAKRRMTRTGGRPGDSVYLTGTVGLSLAGFRHLNGSDVLPETPLTDIPRAARTHEARTHEEVTLQSLALERHLRPRARVAWASALVEEPRVHAVMDLSDGLAQDAGRLARASDVFLDIDLERVPTDPALAGRMSAKEAVASGEEYELLFLGEPGLAFPFPCTCIGRAVARSDMSTADRESDVRFLLAGERVAVDDVGFCHFE